MQGLQTHCPICNRYCGPKEVCPYCEATIPFPVLYKKIRRGAWLLATIGLLALILAGRNHRPDTVSISHITPAMQFATIYVEGKLAHTPRISRNKTSASTELDDGSGTMLRMVFLDQAVEALLSLDPPLTEGTTIRATGGVQIKANEPPVMFIREPEQFERITGGSD